jgi:hypothetical protein
VIVRLNWRRRRRRVAGIGIGANGEARRSWATPHVVEHRCVINKIIAASLFSTRRKEDKAPSGFAEARPRIGRRGEGKSGSRSVRKQ